MKVGQRYLFLGIVTVVIVLVYFFVGLGIDFLLNQEATYAIWAVMISVIPVAIFNGFQLHRLVSQSGASQTKITRSKPDKPNKTD